jgi:hypothetical protein
MAENRMIFEVRVNLRLEADTRQQAQQAAAACLSNCDEEGSFDHVDGVGGARGTIYITERRT